LRNRRLTSGMCHHFVPKEGCCRRSCLGKSAITAPTLDGIAVVRAQGSTLTHMHPEICRTSRSHLVVMHALGVPSLLTCPRDPTSRRRRRSHVTVVCNSRGCCRVHLRETLPCSCPPGSAATATLPSCAPDGATTACVPSGSNVASRSHLVVVRASRGPSPRAGLRDPPPRACPPDPPSRACPQDPPSRACSQDPLSHAPLGGGDVNVGVAKTEP
jgi:hypothetical protein